MRRRTCLGHVFGVSVTAFTGCVQTASNPGSSGDDSDANPDCPEIEEARRTFCSGDSETDIVVEPSEPTVTLPTEDFRMTLRNGSDDSVFVLKSDWALLRYAGDGWTVFESQTPNATGSIVEGNDETTWPVTLRGGEVGTSKDPETDDVRVGSVEPGTYAFRTFVDERDGGEPTAYVARFTVESA